MTCSVRSPGMCTPQRQAKCPGTTAPGPRSRVPFLPSTRHTSCHHSTRVGRLSGEVKALLRFAFTRQVTYEMRLLDAVPLNPGLWKKDHDLSMLIQWKCKADMKCAEGAQIFYFLCLVTQISNVGPKHKNSIKAAACSDTLSEFPHRPISGQRWFGVWPLWFPF